MSALGDKLRAMAAKAEAEGATPAQIEGEAAHLLLEHSLSEEPTPPSPFGMFRPPVGPSKDLDRVCALPRRPSEADAIAPPEVVEALNQELRRPTGTQALRPIQAAALVEARRAGGGFFPIGVGAGKTIISVLLPTVLESKVCVLLVRPDLKKKLTNVEYPDLARNWRIPNLAGSSIVYTDTTSVIHVVSYSQLSTAKSSEILDELKPDTIIADEAHALAGNSARRKRFERYMKANPGTRFCPLSGTMTNRSIKDFATLAKLALRYGAPVPLHWPTLEEWSGALDSTDNRSEPGELVRFCNVGEDVRSGFRRRLVETPGVVATSENHLPTALILDARKLKTPPTISAVLEQMREDWVTPSGEVLTDSLSFYRHARTISAGFYLRWVWPYAVAQDPEFKFEWLEARKLYHKEVRDFLKHRAKPKMDSPFLLALAASKGVWNSEFYGRYSEASREFRRRTHRREPETEAVWLDPFMVEDAAEWARKNAGIVWFDHPDLGRAIAAQAKLPYYGSSAETKMVRDPASGELVPPIVLEKGDRSVVASVKSWGTGWNLQMFSTQLVTTPSSSGKTWEQMLGRMHRPGQMADEVTAYLYQHTPELEDSFSQARKDAAFIQETLGSAQKLVYATIASGIG